jgi:hypothetical protein
VPIEKNKLNTPFTEDLFSDDNIYGGKKPQPTVDLFSEQNLGFRPPQAQDEEDIFDAKNIYKPGENFFTGLAKNKQFVGAAKTWYGKTQPDKVFANDQEVIDTYSTDMRWFDNNLYSAGKTLLTLTGETDKAAIEAFQTMRETWDAAPAFWEDSGGGFAAFAENAWAGATDVSNWLGMGAGVLAKKALTGAIATAGVDAAAGMALNAVQQGAEKEVSLRERINPLEVVGAGAMQAAFPFIVAGGIRVVKSGTDFIAAMGTPDQNAITISMDGVKFMDMNIAQGNVSEHTPTISIFNKETDARPFEVVDEVGNPMGVGGRPIIFSTERQADAFRKQYKSTSKKPIFSREKKFLTVDDAKDYITKNGAALGATNVDSFEIKADGLLGTTKAPNPLARLRDAYNNAVTKTVQNISNATVSIEDLDPKLNMAIKKRIDAGEITPHDIGLVDKTNLAVQINQIENKEVVAKAWVDDRPVVAVHDPKNPGYYKYQYIADGKGLRDIFGEANVKLQEMGIIDNEFSRKLSTYMIALRAENYKKAGKQLSVPDFESKAFLNDIRSNPNVAKVFDEAMKHMQVYNKNLLDFAIAHEVISAKDAKNMMDISDIYVPLRAIDDGVESGGTTQGIKSVQAPGTLKKRVREDEAKYKGNKFIDPLKTYQDFVEIVVKSSMVNRTKSQVIRKIQAAGPQISNTILKEVKPDPKTTTISKDQIQALLNKRGIQIDLKTNPQVEPFLRIFFKELRWGDEKRMGRDFVYVNGERKEFEYRDELIADALINFGTFFNSKFGTDSDYWLLNVPGHMGNALQWMNKKIQSIVTHWPGVSLGLLLPADAVSAAVFNPNMTVRNIPFINAARGFAVSMKSDLYKEAQFNGGLLSGTHSMSAGEIDRFVEWSHSRGMTTKNVIGLSREQDEHIWKKAANNLGQTMADISQLNAVKQALNTVAQKTESATRINSYIDAVQQGKSAAEAAYAAARYSINFRMRGNSEAAHAFQAAMFPFGKAFMNVTYQMGNMAKDKSKLAARGAKYMGFVMVPAVALELINQQDSLYQSISPLEKDMYFFVPIPWTDDDGTKYDYIKIRKPGIIATPANIVRRTIEEMNKDPVSAELNKVMFQYAIETIMHDMRLDDQLAPAGVASYLGVTQNENAFGRPIDMESTKDVAGFAKVNRLTGSKVLNNEWVQRQLMEMQMKTGRSISPNALEFLATSLFAQAAQVGIEASNAYIEMKDGTWSFDPEKMFMVGKVFKSGEKPLRYTSFEDDFRKIQEKVTPVANAVQKILSSGDERSATLLTQMEIKYGQQFNRMRVITKQIEAIQKNKQELTKEMVRLANENYREPDINKRLNEIYQTRNDFMAEQVKELRENYNLFLKEKNGTLAEEMLKDLE